MNPLALNNPHSTKISKLHFAPLPVPSVKSLNLSFYQYQPKNTSPCVACHKVNSSLLSLELSFSIAAVMLSDDSILCDNSKLRVSIVKITLAIV